MAEQYTIKAVLSAVDNGFSSAMGKASSLIDRIKDGVGMGIGMKLFDGIVSGAGEMIGELNQSSAAWKTFNANMKINGHGEQDIARIRGELSKFAAETIYSSSEMASTYAQLDAVGVASAEDLVKGFGGIAASAENPKQAMKTLSTQATQMAAKPMVAWQDFKLILDQAPAGVSAIAKAMGMTTQELVAGVQDGKIKTEDFLNTVRQVGTNGDFAKMARQYKTVDEAMGGLTETLANKLQPAFDGVSKIGIDAISGIVDFVDGVDLAATFGPMIDIVKDGWNSLKDSIGTIDLSQLGSQVETYFKPFADLLTQIDWQGIFSTAAEAIGQFAQGIGNIGGQIMAFLQPLIEQILPVIAEHLSQLAQTAYEFLQGIAERMAPLMEAIGNIVSYLLEVLSPAIDMIVGVVTASWDNICNLFAAAKDIILGILDVFIGIFTGDWNRAWEGVKGIFEAIWNRITGFIQYVWNMITSIVTGGLKIAWNVISSVLGAIASLFSSIWNGITSFLGSIWHGITSTVSNGINSARNFVSSGLNKIAGFFTSIWDGIVRGVRTSFDNVVSAVSNGIQSAYNTVKGWISNFFNAGRNIVNSIADGIRGAIGAVTGAIGSVVGAVRNFLPFSPAKRGPLRDLNRLNFGGTISDSIYQGESQITSAMEDILNVPKLEASAIINPNIGQTMGDFSTEVSAKIADSRLQGEKKPLIANLSLGGRDYRAYVDDISGEQGRKAKLELAYL